MNTDISQCYSKYHGVHMIRIVLVRWYLKKTVILLGAQHSFPSLYGQHGFVCSTWFYRKHRLKFSSKHHFALVATQNEITQHPVCRVIEVRKQILGNVENRQCSPEHFASGSKRQSISKFALNSVFI